jgi:hypothetical protein
VIARDVVSVHNPLRHDPDKLATALFELANGRWRDDEHALDFHPHNDDAIAPQPDVVGASSARE